MSILFRKEWFALVLGSAFVGVAFGNFLLGLAILVIGHPWLQTWLEIKEDAM